MTLETEVAALTVATTKLLDAVNLSKYILYDASDKSVASAAAALASEESAFNSMSLFFDAVAAVDGGLTAATGAGAVKVETALLPDMTKAITVSLDLATQTADGAMSAQDKTSLDEIMGEVVVTKVNGEGAVQVAETSSPVGTREITVSLDLATPDADGAMSAEDKRKLDNVLETARVQSVAGREGHIAVDATDVGLGEFTGLTPLTLPVSIAAGVEMVRIAATVTPTYLHLAPFVDLTPAGLPMSDAALVEADNKMGALLGIAASVVSTQSMLISAVAALLAR